MSAADEFQAQKSSYNYLVIKMNKILRYGLRKKG